MSLIMTVCGRRFRCLSRGAALQEMSDEVRQHLHRPSVRTGDKRRARLIEPVKHAWRHAGRCVGNGCAVIRLALVRAVIAVRPVVQYALGL